MGNSDHGTTYTCMRGEMCEHEVRAFFCLSGPPCGRDERDSKCERGYLIPCRYPLRSLSRAVGINYLLTHCRYYPSSLEGADRLLENLRSLQDPAAHSEGERERNGYRQHERETMVSTNHQPPEVNYIEVLAKVDFPCRVHLRMYRLLDFTKSENGPIVHFWWLVEHHERQRDDTRSARHMPHACSS
jgi:hypothetical protein